jgi:hypothetical protein
MSNVEKFQGVVAVEVVSSKDAAIADIRLDLYNKEEGTFLEYNWNGTSKRFKGEQEVEADNPDHEVGVKLALARAFTAAAKQLERQAMGQLKCNEDNRKASAQSRAARRASMEKVKTRKSRKARIGTHKVPVIARQATNRGAEVSTVTINLSS